MKQCEAINLGGDCSCRGKRCKDDAMAEMQGGHWFCWLHASILKLGRGTLEEVLTGRRESDPGL
jgi:hypothetical protein